MCVVIIVVIIFEKNTSLNHSWIRLSSLVSPRTTKARLLTATLAATVSAFKPSFPVL